MRFTLFTLFILFFFTTDMFPQCSMCRAAVESNSEQFLAKGLNTGILYLMSMPYIFLAISCFFYYTNYKKKI